MSDSIVGIQIRSVPQVALANGFTASSSGTTVYGISGYNSGPAQFIQLIDKAAAASNGDVPAINIKVEATANFSIDFGVYGMPFINGVQATNSSTPATRTVGAADCQFFVRLNKS